MKYAFRMVCSMGASFLSEEERNSIAREVVSTVERFKPFQQEVFILDDTQRGLKIVVRFVKQEVYIMTFKEAADAGLPDKPDHLPSAN